MHQGLALTAVYLTALAIFAALVLQLFGVALTLVIGGFLCFILSVIPWNEFESEEFEPDSESPAETRSRWR